VKAPFADDHGRELLWVAVRHADERHVVGTVDSQPATVKAVAVGQQVRVPRGQLADWLFIRGGRMTGGFTLSGGDRRAHDTHGERPG
jgi:uncharacterized protein YegJ (DUF2314 family)